MPIKFQAGWEIDKANDIRPVPRTMLQSMHLRKSIGVVYGSTLNEDTNKLDEILKKPLEAVADQLVHENFKEAHAQIRKLLLSQVKKRHRNSGPHVNAELLRLWETKGKRSIPVEAEQKE